MPNWTKDQLKVIETRDNNILVSAAAGSGKTAVLVERIIGKIINDKVEVDKLLVVTFTNAAAREMKLRIRKALENAIKDDAGNEFLIRQNTLIASADISTIDSFCGKLVRENYNDIGIDPSFRICDENEKTLLFQEAVDRVLDSNFEAEDNEAFIDFVNLYADARDYSTIYNIIEGLYTRSQSYPWQKEWLNDIFAPYNVTADTKLKDIGWVNEMYEEAISSLGNIREELSEFLENITPYLTFDKKGKNKAKSNIETGIEYIDVLISSRDMEELYNNIGSVKKMSKGEATFTKSLDLEPDSDDAHFLYMSYEQLSDSYNELYASLSGNKTDNILDEIMYMSPYAHTLISLTSQVAEVFDEIKAEKNVATFSDIEHFALNILINPETKEITDTARQLQQQYNEVMVDEYQDINDLQEMILCTISNGKNMFMVGDVKQSIYGFRMAKPDIFVNKSDLYSHDDDDLIKDNNNDGDINTGVLINLKSNFRSRREVLDTVNNIFLHIMTKETSGFQYDDDAKLYFGAEEMYGDGTSVTPEVIIVDSEEEDFDSSREIEAAIVAERIKELFDEHFQVKDKDSNGNVIYRDIMYSDIAIILRAANTNGRVYEEALLNAGIPCHASDNKGYFDTVEVKLMLDFLSVIDNPCHDIELISVLHSPIFNISNDMLAMIRIFGDKSDISYEYLFYLIQDYINDKTEAETNNAELNRLISAMDMIGEFRNLVYDTPIHELLEMIYERTSYIDYVSAGINGQYKRANLQALIDKALDFEKTAFVGVFRFLKYIETMREYDIDMGEASIAAENDDVVKILTMHKSKGLEFPVVFVSDLGAQMKDMDINNSNIIHNTLGLGLELRREVSGNKYRKDSQYKQYIKKLKKKDYMSEEARLLYVAATRAKEKLILTAAYKEPEDKINKFMSGDMDYNRMINAKSRLEWIIRGIETSNPHTVEAMITYRSPEASVIKDVIEYSYIAGKKEEFLQYVKNTPPDIRDEIKKRLSYEYPYEINDNLKTKYSVSDIKQNAIEEAFEEEDAKINFTEEEKEKVIPEFIEEKTEPVNAGSLYGTAMHRVMECYDFVSDDYDTSLMSQLDSMLQSGFITDEQREMISVNKLNKFINCDIAKRMHIAAIKDNLWIEQPFVLQENPKELFDDVSDNNDNIIVQGIIDVFYVEDDGIVLLDYKTDKADNEDELISHYKGQIDLYAKAIESSFNINVKEKLIYSFYLDKIVTIG